MTETFNMRSRYLQEVNITSIFKTKIRTDYVKTVSLTIHHHRHRSHYRHFQQCHNRFLRFYRPVKTDQ